MCTAASLGWSDQPQISRAPLFYTDLCCSSFHAQPELPGAVGDRRTHERTVRRNREAFIHICMMGQTHTVPATITFQEDYVDRHAKAATRAATVGDKIAHAVY